MKKQRGFTLVELMVTVVVVVIIATMAAPNLQSAIKKREVETTESEFEKLLSQSRADATLFRRNITVHIKSDGSNTPTDRYWNLAEDMEVTFRGGICSEDGRWSKSTLNSFNNIVFLPQGNVKDLPNNLEIQINNNYENRYLYVTNLGRISTSRTSIFEGEC